MAKGKLIVIYGINNLGKTTQARLLIQALTQKGINASYLKYPLYELEPSGPLLNDYLRKGNPFGLSSRESQIVYILNRTQYDSELRQRLERGDWVVAEDYTGTGLAWGMGGGVARDFLERLSVHLLKEDLAFLFEGKRFLEACEQQHLHEQNDELMEKVRNAHQELAKDYGWVTINANDSIETIAGTVWSGVQKKFEL